MKFITWRNDECNLNKKYDVFIYCDLSFIKFYFLSISSFLNFWTVVKVVWCNKEVDILIF